MRLIYIQTYTRGQGYIILSQKLLVRKIPVVCKSVKYTQVTLMLQPYRLTTSGPMQYWLLFKHNSVRECQAASCSSFSWTSLSCLWLKILLLLLALLVSISDRLCWCLCFPFPDPSNSDCKVLVKCSFLS